ncbi:hypothetical protein MMC20_001142 [Loxospora ochrophaea]|nr:hypothetical protein [Loxospora ochrophaea]
MPGSLVDHALSSVRGLEIAVPVKLGPFNQISIPVKACENAIYFAKDAYGWWKSAEKIQCLEEMIGSKKGELSAALTFNPRAFKLREQEYPVHGVAIGDEEGGGTRLRSYSGAVASPSAPQTDGGLCLKALTTGLLCLFGEDRKKVCKILVDIIPEFLIRYEQEGIRLEKQGPLASAVAQWVNAIAAEEDNRRRRVSLLAMIDSKERNVTDATIEELRNCFVFELPLAIAFISWLLSSEYKRDSQYKKAYPTRSFRIWSLALILGELGFEVDASLVAISTKEMYHSHVQSRSDPSSYPQVFLVTQAVGSADPGVVPKDNYRDDASPKRLIPIMTIPLVAFKHYAYYTPPTQCQKVMPGLLEEIFAATFEHVQCHCLAFLSLQPSGQNVTSKNPGNPFDGPLEGLSKYQSCKLQDWVTDNRIRDLLAKPIAAYLPVSCPDSCGKSKCQDSVKEGETWNDGIRARHEDMGPWIKMHMIMIAFAYAVACQFLKVGDGQSVSIDNEIVWQSIPFFPGVSGWRGSCLINPDLRVRFWVLAMVTALGISPEIPDGMEVEDATHARVKRALYQMITGKDLEPEQVSVDALGCCANGLTLLSEILISPSLDSVSMFVHRLQFGRILELPVSTRGLLEACPRGAFVDRRSTMKTTRAISVIYPDAADDWTIPGVRWDPEPDWERDERKIGLRCRINGIPRFIFNPWIKIASNMSDTYETIHCYCSSKKSPDKIAISFPPNELWLELSIRDFYQDGGYRSGIAPHREHLRPGQSSKKCFLFVRAGSRKIDQLACLDLIKDHGDNDDVILRKLLAPCLSCAMEPARKDPPKTRRVSPAHVRQKHHLVLIVLSR